MHSHRKTLAAFRADLDAELAKDRARHAAALEEQHVGYERQLVADRVRAEAKLVAANERHALEAAADRHANQQHHDRQAIQHKATIKELRNTSESSNAQRRELEKANQLMQIEIATLQKQALQNETEHASTARRTAQELALVQAELDGERERIRRYKQMCCDGAPRPIKLSTKQSKNERRSSRSSRLLSLDSANMPTAGFEKYRRQPKNKLVSLPTEKQA